MTTIFHVPSPRWRDKVKPSILFYGLCALLDEVSTFSILALGGEELNPRLSLTLGMNPVFWPLMDIAVLISLAALLRILKFKGSFLLPVGAGAARLLYFLWNVTQIIIWL